MSAKGPFLFRIDIKDEALGSQEAYDELYGAASLSQIESFYIWLLRIIKPHPDENLLDVSSGAGELVNLASRAGVRSFGIDISETVARKAVSRSDRPAAFFVGAGEHLPFSNRHFSIVTNIGSLEHFNDPVLGVQEMARVLRPDGRAYILVPNTFSLLSNVWEAFRHGRTAVDAQPIQRYGAKEDWVLLLEQNNLRVVETIKYERPWPYQISDWKYYLRRPKELFRMILGPVVPLNLAFCFLFVCRKKAQNSST